VIGSTFRVAPFPILTVDWIDLHRLHRSGVEATRVHVVAIGMGAGNIKRFHATVGAEQVSRGTRIEGVGGERFLALEQLEAGRAHNEPQITRFAANRAVALRHGDVRWRQHLVAHAPAMTSASVLDERCPFGHAVSPSPSA
jgi:hypothetical protein